MEIMQGSTKCEMVNGDCLEVLKHYGQFDCIFADPPDGIGLRYAEYQDKMSEVEYLSLMERWLHLFVHHAQTTWVSFNARWTVDMGVIVKAMVEEYGIEVKPCVQVFTFGQHNHHDFGNNHRPLWRLRQPDAPIYPNQIRVPSWRQLNGDKRADPRGRVPGDVTATFAEDDIVLQRILEAEELTTGTVFDFPRVTGNSKQRRAWHPTQLAEDLVERCIKSCTCEGGTVFDPFAGTGTTLRVCKRIGRDIVICDVDAGYCDRIAAEHGIQEIVTIPNGSGNGWVT